jgi:23S rRNA pseudouridine1911/1915/1917 synthase
VPEDRPLDILYQDEHLVVVNKPPGLTVHPSETQAEGTLVHILLHHVRDLSGIGGETRPGIVHRIDKNTSGALVITKTDVAHRGLADTFSRHEIERAYWALCFGSPAEPSGRIESLIGRNPNDRKKMSMEVKEGRRAVTHWRRIEEYGRSGAKPFASLVEARLETGRTHQVRVHLTGLGHSLLGDPTYGTPSERAPKWLAVPFEIRTLVLRLPGQALHARVLGFAHPVTGEKLRFEAPVPPQFAAVQEALAKYR